MMILGLALSLMAQDAVRHAAQKDKDVAAAEVVQTLRASKRTVPEAVLKQDALVIKSAIDKNRLKGMSFWIPIDKRLEHATVAWDSVRMSKDDDEPILIGELEQAAAQLGRLFVNSVPGGGSVTVDGYSWKRRTNADGFAAPGTRVVVVTKDAVSVRVTCDIQREAIVTATVDFGTKTGVCK